MKSLITIIFFALIISCKSEKPVEITMQEDVSFLADDKLEGRQTGTKGEKAAAEYIAKRFKDLGLTGAGTEDYFQTFSFKPKTDPHQEVSYTVVDGDSVITGINVLGLLDNNWCTL